MICDKCKGEGFNLNLLCDKCFGTGEVNWIENIFGKRKYYEERIWNIIVSAYNKYPLRPFTKSEAERFQSDLDQIFINEKFRVIYIYNECSSTSTVKYVKKGTDLNDNVI